MANDSGKRKRVPPSRKRYEQAHPIVSARVDVETYKELQELKRVFAELPIDGRIPMGMVQHSKHFALNNSSRMKPIEHGYSIDMKVPLAASVDTYMKLADIFEGGLIFAEMKCQRSTT